MSLNRESNDVSSRRKHYPLDNPKGGGRCLSAMDEQTSQLIKGFP